MDTVIIQTAIVIGVMVSLFGITQLQLRGLQSRLREDMRQNHQELKSLVIGHFHSDTGELAFRLPQGADD